ncbi:SPOR domain-containing protein [Clostridium sp.]|uniref:SPOR domain-containing protein n=1 Tax=Clostridium sp. TaxID=1506 RepID=UPI002622518A|nr:SPOR domain-containing protein [Clostridium sp.]
MRYTKYNHKRKKESSKFLLSLILTTTLALALGGISAKIILKVMPSKINIETELIEKTNSEITDNKIQNFVDIYYIQCGYFSKEESAKEILGKLNSKFNGFIIKDEMEKYRVIAGVAKGEDAKELTEKLSESFIDNAKIGIKLDKNNKIEGQILVIIDGILEITKSIEDEEVKNINTKDFKAWMNNLDKIEEGEKSEILKDLKKHVEEMPEEINNENAIKEIEYIYFIIKRVG